MMRDKQKMVRTKKDDACKKKWCVPIKIANFCEFKGNERCHDIRTRALSISTVLDFSKSQRTHDFTPHVSSFFCTHHLFFVRIIYLNIRHHLSSLIDKHHIINFLNFGVLGIAIYFRYNCLERKSSRTPLAGSLTEFLLKLSERYWLGG